MFRERALIALVAVLSLAGCDERGFAVEVTITAAPALAEDVVRSVRALVIHVDGSETFDARYAVVDQLDARVARWVYVPSKRASEASFRVTAEDGQGVALAAGESALVALSSGHRSQAEVVLGPPPISAGEDLAGPDLSSSDAAAPDLLPPLTLAFAPAVFSVAGGSLPAPLAIAAGPIDGDLSPDALVANPGNPGVYLFQNQGDGTLGVGTQLTGAGRAVAVALGRLDVGASVDLVFVDQAAAEVIVCLADSMGGCVQARYAVGALPVSVVVGDLNGDTFNDLAITNQGSNSISVLVNDRTGHFGAQLTYGTSPGPRSLAILPRGSTADLVVASPSTNAVSVLHNNGVAIFSSTNSYATETTPFAVAVGDLDGDGRSDIAVACQDGYVSVLADNGLGGFSPAVSHAVGGTPWGIAAGDMDLDGTLDLVITQNTTNSVNVLLQREAFGTSHLFFVGTFGHDLALADFDQDGLLDIATTGSNGLGILLNRSTR